MESGVIPGNVVTAVLCRRVSDVIVIVASAFKSLSDHGSASAGVLVHKKIKYLLLLG